MKRSVHNIIKPLGLALAGVVITVAASAQVYTSKQDGNWNAASTWVGNAAPPNVITSGMTVNIVNDVTFNGNQALTVSGKLNITGDTLHFGSGYAGAVTFNSGSTLSITNGGFIQSTSNGSSNFTLDGARMVVLNSRVIISEGVTAKNNASRFIKNSVVNVAGKYDLSGTATLKVKDTVQNSIIETGMSKGGDFTITNATLVTGNAFIRVDNNNSFQNNSSGVITVLPGANSNFGFDQLKISKDLKNDGAWTSRIDAACIGGNITGSQMAAIDFTRAQDCGTTNIGNAPELIFVNPVLKSGQPNKQGAIYRFANVITGVDAEIKLKKFSRSDIVMQNVDVANLGWDKAFQPQFGLAGNVAPFQDWYIDFEMKFYVAGTNTPKTMTKVDLTALDVDGDGVSISEYAIFQNPSNVMYSSVTYLANQTINLVSQSFTCPLDNIVSPLTTCLVCGGDGKTGMWNLTDCTACNGTGMKYTACGHAFDGTNGNLLGGPVENFTNIDTAATQVMATYQYLDVNKIDFRYGAKSGTATSNAGIRLNSLWARQFSLAPPTILPVTLTEFNATLNKKDVTLNWTAHEDNTCSYYIVQRSTDARNYKDIAVVFVNNASNKNSYTVKDANVSSPNGVVYYRLQMMDNTSEGGKFSPTRIIKLGKDESGIVLTTYPNPVNDQVRVTLPSAWQGKPVVLQLYSANGVLMQSMQISNASQTETLQMNKATKGFYVVKAACNGEVAEQRIVKN